MKPCIEICIDLEEFTFEDAAQELRYIADRIEEGCVGGITPNGTTF